MNKVNMRTTRKEDVKKALWYIENVYIYQWLIIGLFLTVGIHIYFFNRGYIATSIIYSWIIGITFGYAHSYLRCLTLLKTPKVYADAFQAERLIFRHPIKAFRKFIRFIVYEWYFFLFIIIMFIIPAFIPSRDYSFELFILELSVYGIFQGIFWRYRMRKKVNKKYGINDGR